LQALGYPAVEETVINPFIGYATRCYAPPAGFPAPWKALLVGADLPEMRRGGGIVPIEGNRWLVTLSGAGRDYPPTDERGFLEFARSLRTPALYEAIKDARPLAPSPATGPPRTAGGATSAWPAGPSVSSSWATPRAASTRSTARACRLPLSPP
jgi:hypothetical protein